MERVERFDGKVALEICEQFVRLFWIRDVSDTARKTFKQSLLKEFEGKLVIDFRKRGSGTVMNDMVGIVSPDIDIVSLKNEIVDSHERVARRSTENTTYVNENQIKLFDAETLKGELTVTFYIPQRKVVAQANPETLKHFIRIYGNAVNKLTNGPRIPSNQIATASQEWVMNSEELSSSQEQSEVDVCLTEWNEIVSPQESTVLTTAEEEEVARLSTIDPYPTEYSRPVSEELFIKFQQSITADFHLLKEMQKEVLEKMPVITEVIKRVDEVERKLALANGELLIQNEAIAKLQSKNDELNKKLREQKTAASKYEKDFRKLCEVVEETKSEITKVSSASCQPDFEQRISSFEEKVAARVDGFIESAENRIKEAIRPISPSAQRSPIPTQCPQHVPDTVIPGHSVTAQPTTSTEAHRPRPGDRTPAANSNPSFDSDVILFMDSNGKYIDERILANGVKVQKVTAYTIPQAIDVLKSCNFEKQPEKILFHLGTNDLDYAPPDEIASKMNDLLHLARSRCPRTKFYVSAILPRLSKKTADIEERVEFTNTAYGTLTGSMPGCFLIDHHINIQVNMLSDDRHLNKIGFYTMLANIRFFMFNILPRSRRSR